MGGDRERWTGTTAQWTALRGTSWRPGDAETRGLSRGGACTACGHYPDIVVDEKRDRKRLAHLLTERSPDGGPTDRTHVSLASWSTGKPVRVKSQVRTGLLAGGKEIRIVGPAVKEKPFRRAIWLLFARTYRTSGLADETGTSRIKKFTLP
jgi:hypothetical protein